jgi:hypothetical protein
MNHYTVAHYVLIPYPIPNMGRGVVFFDDDAKQKRAKRGSYSKSEGKYLQNWKVCPVCNEYKRFARAKNRLCSRKCAANEQWANRR